MTVGGNISGREYFLSIGVYPYRGGGAYNLQPLRGAVGDYPSTPDPLIDEAPGGYPGFLNFVPKSKPGNAYAPYAGSGFSRMEVDAGERAGWFDSQMVTLNQATVTPLHTRVMGHFVCGPPFTP